MRRLAHIALTTALTCGLVSAVGLVPVRAAGKPDAKKPDAKHAPEPKKAEPAPPPPEPEPQDDFQLPAGMRQPYDMMRELRQLQDRIAQGDTEALVKQRQMTDAMIASFAQLDDRVWRDPRNGRAILAFVLSGGDPKALRELLLRGQPKGINGNLARAVHAFATGRRGEALEYFARLDPLTLDPSIAGQVAMAQSELDQARLLAPGTLIEEAALRRQIGLFSARKEFAAADKYTEIYFRRFARSAYATTLKRQIVRFAMDRPPLDANAPMALLVSALDRLGRGQQLEMYLEMAREAVSRARRDIVMFTAEKALTLTQPDSVYEARAKIYVNSMHAASLGANEAREALEALKSKTDAREDQELISVSQAIAHEVRTLSTVTPSSTPDPQWVSELGATFSSVGRGQGMIANADKLLVEASK